MSMQTQLRTPLLYLALQPELSHVMSYLGDLKHKHT